MEKRYKQDAEAGVLGYILVKGDSICEVVGLLILEDFYGTRHKVIYKKLKKKEGLDVVFLYYLQLIDSEKRSENRNQDIFKIARTPKLMAKKLDITKAAQVSRNSFYRNYNTKEDIIRSKIEMMLLNWGQKYAYMENTDIKDMYGDLFGFITKNQKFFLLMRRKNLFYLFQEVFIQKYGATEEDNNLWAYIKSFIAYGNFGWIEEWVSRGMEESAEEMKRLLSSQKYT